MRKITIIGCAGSGKTTFAKKLSKKLDLPLHTIDSIYYRENWEKLSQDELRDKLVSIMKTDGWIIDGQYTKHIPLRLEFVDTVIFFDISKLIAIQRILKRYVMQKIGKETRLGNNKVHFPWHQMKLVLTYPRRYVYELLRCIQKDKTVIVFKNSREADTFLNTV